MKLMMSSLSSIRKPVPSRQRLWILIVNRMTREGNLQYSTQMLRTLAISVGFMSQRNTIASSRMELAPSELSCLSPFRIMWLITGRKNKRESAHSGVEMVIIFMKQAASYQEELGKSNFTQISSVKPKISVKESF